MSQVPLSSIINISISRQTQGVTQAGFGVPLILTDETPQTSWGAELIREYTSTTEVLDDWSSSDEVYLAAVAIFAQTPKVTLIKVGLETTRVAQQTTIVFDAALVTGNTVSTFDLSLGGQEDTITATPFNTSNALTLADITAKIDALGNYSAADNGTDTITITASTAGASFTCETPTVTGGASQAEATVTVSVDNVGPAESLANISDQDDEWYGVIWKETNELLVYGMAAYIETLRRLFGTRTDDVDAYDATDTDDIGYILSTANFERTYLFWNGDTADYADAAYMGKLFPYDPGSASWKFKTLSGITADASLTSSQRTALSDKNYNMYVEIAGVSVTQEGVVASGEYIDIIRGVDWLQARMEERIYSRLVNLPKIPFTNAGIGIVEAEIRAVLENAIKVGLISPDPIDPDSDDRTRSSQPYIITVPEATDVPANDRAERHLTGIEFEARVAGAVHKVTVQGIVTI